MQDALRQRDARRVIELMQRYKLDKDRILREFEAAKEERERQHQEELDEIRKQADDRLAELAREYKLKRQREEEDHKKTLERMREDHADRMSLLRAGLEERLIEMSREYAEEYGLSKSAMEKLYSMLKSYYGKGGLFESLYAYNYATMVNYAQAIVNELYQFMSNVSPYAGFIPSLFQTPIIPQAVPNAPIYSSYLGEQMMRWMNSSSQPSTNTVDLNVKVEASPDLIVKVQDTLGDSIIDVVEGR